MESKDQNPLKENSQASRQISIRYALKLLKDHQLNLPNMWKSIRESDLTDVQQSEWLQKYRNDRQRTSRMIDKLEKKYWFEFQTKHSIPYKIDRRMDYDVHLTYDGN